MSRGLGDVYKRQLTGANVGLVRDVENQIHHYLDEANAQSGKPYRADCSMGHYMTQITARESFEECMRMSDIEMYKEKKAKKVGR